MSRCVLFLSLVTGFCAAAMFAQTCPPGVSWCSGLYRYDGMGNIRAIGSDTYIYDTAGRLVSGTAEVQRGGTSRQDYTYDTFGNRTGAARIAGSVDCLGGCEQSPAIDPATNHITSNGAQYDAAGNLIAIQNTVNGVTYSASYTYDAAGSLTRATAGSDDRQFIYTADDERIAIRNGQNWTWTVRDLDNKVLREFTSLEPNGQPGLPTLNRQWAKDYIWRDGLLLASVVPTTPGASTTLTQHFHLDHLGTPRLVSNDAGVQIGIHAYYPFGAELNLSQNEQPGELMKFTGHERDLLPSNPNTLDYMHARYDSAIVGRFLSVDPGVDIETAMHHPQGWNRYSYALNNPIGYIDPDGRNPFGVVLGGAALGAVEGALFQVGFNYLLDRPLSEDVGRQALYGAGIGAVTAGIGVVVENAVYGYRTARAVNLAIESANAAVRLEGEAAAALGKSVTGFNKVVRSGGKVVGEIDVETSKAIVEVTGGRSPRKLDQITKLITNKTMNPQGKQVVVYGPNLGRQAAQTLEKAGAKVARTLEELRKLAQ